MTQNGFHFDWSTPRAAANTMYRFRKHCGYSEREMAAFLRFSDDDNGARSIRSYENGKRDISGPIQLAMEYRMKFGNLHK